MRKRSSLNELVSPPKKGPTATHVSENISITPTFTLASLKKLQLELYSKLLGKGKKKSCFSCCSYCFWNWDIGGFVKPPQHQWNFFLGTAKGSLGLLQFAPWRGLWGTSPLIFSSSQKPNPPLPNSLLLWIDLASFSWLKLLQLVLMVVWFSLGDLE